MRTRERAGEGNRVAGEAIGDETEIVARVRAGETEAYGELVRAHTPIAHRTAVLLGAGADAEDVVQNAFVKAYLGLDRFQDGAAFRPWLLRIVANETKNTLRSAVRRRSAVGREAAMAGPEPLIPESADPAVAAVAGERREALLAALGRLSEPQRRVVTYRYLLDLDEAETAEALGWPRGTVKSRLSRGLRCLERLLSADAAVGSAAVSGADPAGGSGAGPSGDFGADPAGHSVGEERYERAAG